MTKHVVIAGGGVGALEGLLALQALAADRVRISVVTPSRAFAYPALSVAEPFGAPPPARYEWEAIARDRGVEWVPDALVGVRPGDREIDSRDGAPVPYDALLLALGARPGEALPGALRFAGPRDVLALREAIEGLAPGRPHTLAFVAPAGAAWTLPLYELALLTAENGRRAGLDLAIALVTAEPAPLAIFGAEGSDAVAHRLKEAGVRVMAGAHPLEVAAGRLLLSDADPLRVDIAVALPRPTGRPVPGLPHDDDGFVPVDPYCRVRGTEHVWAVGDMTAHALKQGGLAAQQADAAAAAIAAGAGAPVKPAPYHPVLRGLLLTGGEPEFLQHGPGAPPRSRASSAFLWWPAQKVAGRHLARYLESLGPPDLPGASAA
jgi:sulfide:quinone oxidoreductase